MKITRQGLTNKIYKRIGKTVHKKYIYDILGTICDYIVDEIVDNRVVSISNFGTFNPYKNPGHNGVNVATKELYYVPPFKTIKFRPHLNFNRLVQQRQRKVRLKIKKIQSKPVVRKK